MGAPNSSMDSIVGGVALPPSPPSHVSKVDAFRALVSLLSRVMKIPPSRFVKKLDVILEVLVLPLMLVKWL
jgi:hypothetical protein